MQLKALWNSYISSFQGLSREVWWLAFLTLVNRAGGMVIPFLSLYLTKERGLPLSEVGWIMTAFGAGSIAGSWFGGYLNDRIGSYPTMILSLVCSAVLFILVQFPSSLFSISIIVFFAILFSDIFRPAMFIALRSYSIPSNQTRSLSLIRLAINLGFSLGPAIGGFLIFYFNYAALFWVDGLTCFIAALLLIRFLNPKKIKLSQEEPEMKNNRSAYKDKTFLLFCMGLFLFGLAFLQYFSSVPLYYSQHYLLSEKTIGLLLAFNGLMVFLIEMPLVHWLEQKKKNAILWVVYGIGLLLASFIVLQLNFFVGWLWLGMLFMSFAEMLAFPFSNALAMQRAKQGKMGQYMGLYSIAFSLAHLIGHNAGMQLISSFGFPKTWLVFSTICLICIGFFILSYQKTKKEQ